MLTEFLPDGLVTENALKVIGAITAAFIALAMMFHSRHHGIHEHERNLRRELVKMITTKTYVEDRVSNIRAQLNIIQKRYRYALIAFILLMSQTFLLLLVVVQLSIEHYMLHMGVWIFFLLGISAIVAHIAGDLLLAFKSQRISRQYVKLLISEVEYRKELGLPPTSPVDWSH